MLFKELSVVVQERCHRVFCEHVIPCVVVVVVVLLLLLLVLRLLLCRCWC